MKSPSERLREALVMVQEFWEKALAPLPTPSAGKAPGPAGSRPPLPTGSLSARAEVFEFLASWRRHTTDWFEDNPTTWEVPGLAAWFRSHADELVLDEVIVDELQGLERLAEELRDAANPPVPAGPALGPCPTCHHVVRWDPLRLQGVCEGCGAARPWKEWMGTLGVNGYVTDKLASILLAAEGRRVTPATIRKWAERGKIARHEVNGRTLYDPEEVLAATDRRTVST